MIGKTISHYRVIEKIGEGGMGVVYLAEHSLLGRRVAIKMLTVGGAGNQHFRSRFLREAQAVSKLSHPNIANIYDYGETDDGQPYIVMELVEGQTLNEVMRAETLTIARAIDVVTQVAQALSEAHRHGIVHRDIKPSNIAINERGIVKVLDFGLAKHAPSAAEVAESSPSSAEHTKTREGVIVGTPLYLSPEQALGLEVDARSDLFSLGSVLYECIAGQPPFTGKSDIDICAKVIRDDPPPPSQFNNNVSRDLDRLALKALSKKPEARFQTAAELIASLETVVAAIDRRDSTQAVTRQVNSGLRARSTSALATLSNIFRRPRLSLGYVIAGVVLLGFFVFIFSRLTHATLPPPAPPAQQLYEKGLAALREGSYFRASKLFERAVAIDDKFALAHARLAEAYTELDYADRAKDQMLSAARIVTDRSMLDRTNDLYYEAIQASVTRDFTGAIKSYEELAKLNPNDDAAYLDLGRAYEDHDETDKAIEQYSKASSLNPTNPAPLLRLGVLYGRRQDLAKSNAAFDKADDLYKDEQNIEGNAEVAYQRGYLLNQMSKIPEAREAAQHSLDVAKLAGNQYQQVRALLLLSAVAYSSGDTAGAQPLATQALDLARANALEDLATQGLLDLSNASLLRRSFDDAERYARQGLELAQRYKEKRNEARANLLLGSNYIQQSQADRGSPFVQQALAFYQTGGFRREISNCMIMVGRTQLLKGDFEGAIKTLDDQLQLAKQVEDPGQLARTQEELAPILSKQSFFPQALVRYTESYQNYKSLKNSFHVAFCLINRADMLAQLGQFTDAVATLDELQPYVAALPTENNYKEIWTGWSSIIRARIGLSREDYPEASKRAKEALTVLTSKNNISIASAKALLGLAQVRSGQTSEAKRTCQQAVDLALATNDSRTIAETRLALAEVLLAAGDAQGATTTSLKAQEDLSKLHLIEPEWRAWVVAARANRVAGDSLSATQQVAQAQTVLEKIHRKWGEQAFQTYVGRPDIRSEQRQLAEFSAGT